MRTQKSNKRAAKAVVKSVMDVSRNEMESTDIPLMPNSNNILDMTKHHGNSIIPSNLQRTLSEKDIAVAKKEASEPINLGNNIANPRVISFNHAYYSFNLLKEDSK